MASMNRREFVGALAGVAGSAVAGSAVVSPAFAAAHRLHSATSRVALGKSGVHPTFVGIGTGVHGWMRSSNSTRMGYDAFEKLIRHAYDSGIRFFDCADLYGTHPMLARALKGIPRESYVIESKLWWRPEGLPEQVKDGTAAIERFRKELQTDYIDNLLVHCTTDATWATDLRPLMDQIGQAKEKGILKAHGTSCHSMPALQTSLDSPWVDVQLARVNHRGAIMDGTPAEISGVLQKMRAAGKGVIGMKIFGEGRFRTPEERLASLQFVIGQRCVDAMVIGFETPAQIDETLSQINGILKQA